MSLSTTIKAIQDIMRKDAGVAGDAQRIEQLGWMLFLKIFSDLEEELELTRDGYTSPVPENLRWHSWADSERLGKDAPTGDALLTFVDGTLFPTLQTLDLAAFDGEERDRAAIIQSVFEDAHNYMKSGTLLRQVIDRLQAHIDFNHAKTRHLFGDIYEQILKDLQGAGNAGEFYTPRAVTQFAVDMVDPRVGELVFDPACGTGGFLTCSYEHMKEQVEKIEDQATLEDSIRGVEKKPLPHLLCVTNMMVHGIAVPSHIRHGNTLAKPLRDYGPKDQVDVIVTNPPFGGMEEDGIENNFPSEFRTRETADLFLVLVVELLKDGGRAAVVLPDGFLFGEGTKTRIKEKLLRDCDLHTIVRLPQKVFAPYADAATNILFFTKGRPTEEIWFFEHPYPEGQKSYSKTQPIRLEEFEPQRKWWTAREEGRYAWRVDIEDVARRNYNLDIPNPNAPVRARADLPSMIERRRSNDRCVLEEREQLRTTFVESVKASGRLPSELVGVLDDNWRDIYSVPQSIPQFRRLVLAAAATGCLVPQLTTDGDGKDTLSEARRLIGEDLSNGLAPTPRRIRRPSPIQPLFDVPQNWVWARLEDIAVYIQRGKSPQYVDCSSVPVVSQKCVQWAGFDLKRARFVSEPSLKKYGAERFLVQGDLLWNSTGTGTIGRVNVFPASHAYPRIIADSHVTVVRTRGVDPHWVWIWLASPFVFEGIEERASGSTNQIELNQGMARLQVTPIPPLLEQRRIVAKVAQLMALSDRLETRLWEVHGMSEQLAESVVHNVMQG